VAVGGVDDHRPAVGPAVHQHVVADAAGGVAHQAVAGLAVFHRGGVVGVDVLDEVQRVGAAEGEAAHVADVEQARGGAHRAMFIDDGGVLHGHVPAAELDHAAAVGRVPVVQGGAQGHGTSFGAVRAASLNRRGANDKRYRMAAVSA